MSEATGANIDLDPIPLSELTDSTPRILLDTIDSLRELGLGDIVSLPQIVMVGSQSAGKSSVLEAISGVQFPAKGGVCTRFATELVLRPAQETRIDARVERADVPRSSGTPRYSRVVFNGDTLPEIINEAVETVGIRLDSAKDFSTDVLHVEITGPEVVSLTLVDLPGFFHIETDEQTLEGRAVVQRLTKYYMQQPKSIILAVASANQELAHQIVLEETKKYDPKRERTLGVITKPDLAGPQDEKKYIHLARGLESINKLQLGWHVLRNRSEGNEQIPYQQRNLEEESFFRSGAWSRIPESSRGATTLRNKLSKLLLRHIQKSLPSLIKDIETELSSRQLSLQKLGKPRSEAADLRSYLLDIAERFQRLARDGSEGRYGDDFFSKLSDGYDARRLRASLRNLNRAFYVTLITKGVDRKIEWEDDERDMFYQAGPDWARDGDDPPEYLKYFLRLFNEFPHPPLIDELALCEELETLAANSQGTEFPGLPNSNLAPQLFKMQIRPWADIAGYYLDCVVHFAQKFVEELFLHIVGADEQTSNALMRAYVVPYFESKKSVLRNKLDEIIRPYKNAYGPPLDADFHATLLATTTQREAAAIASLLEESFPAAFTEKGGKGLTHEQVELAFSSERSRASEMGTEKMSLSTFTQNIINLAVENCLVSDLHTIFTTSTVTRMSVERLSELALESADVLENRQTLQHEIEILLSGLEQCQLHRQHARTVLPEYVPHSPPPSRVNSST
ncbi:P-loop containing nucleoside triphosphate hydrolase protein [Xylaria arbuscula]|nr:P-loop containing nucleoside triphosphate hydrolase protein [Xylaria arbuscula]